MTTLLDYKYRKHWASGKGENGSGNNRHGKNGSDLIIPVPLGTEIIDDETGNAPCRYNHRRQARANHGPGQGRTGQRAFCRLHQPDAARGREAAAPARTIHIRLSLKVMAEVGIIGYPNAGKSTLIARISRARPKIADYPFTTLTPNLGMVRFSDDLSFVVADIPGIIEGAHEGVGLGIRFLKHVERTRLLIHLVDCDPENGRNPYDDYVTLNRELSSYSARLSEKPQIVAASKIDIPGAREKLALLAEAMKGLSIDIFPISAMNGEGVRELVARTANRLGALRLSEPHGQDPSPE